MGIARCAFLVLGFNFFEYLLDDSFIINNLN